MSSIYNAVNDYIKLREPMIEVDYENDPIVQKIIYRLCENIDETIAFLDTECSGNQLVWLSEIFDELAEESQSKALVDAFERTAQKYPIESKEFNLSYFLESARTFLEQ